MVHATHRVDAAGSPRPKSTLYCTECGHASHVFGDWTISARGSRIELVCPDCGTSIADRPASPNAPVLASPSTRAASAWSRFVVTSTAVWRETLEIGASSVSAVARHPE